MFLSIYENSSGQEFLRRISPSEKLHLRAMVRKWAEGMFDGYRVNLTFSEDGAHIPNGCGEYQAEIRHTKASGGVCWTSAPFYLDVSEG